FLFRPITMNTALLVALGYVAFIALVELSVRIRGREAVDPTIWACLAGYLAAISIPLTLALQGKEAGPLPWTTTFGAFAVIATILAATTKGTAVEKPVEWQTWTAIISIVVAGCVVATLAGPLVAVLPQAWIYAVAVFVATALTFLLLFLNENVYE